LLKVALSTINEIKSKSKQILLCHLNWNQCREDLFIVHIVEAGVEYPERTTNHGQATGKLNHLRLRVECTFCDLQSQARIHAVLVIGFQDGNTVDSFWLVERKKSYEKPLWNLNWRKMINWYYPQSNFLFCSDPISNMAITKNNCFWLAEV
jgi:hypothetical protein